MTTPRDPSATWARHDRAVRDHDSSLEYVLRNGAAPANEWAWVRVWEAPKELARGLLCRYSRGDSLDALREHFRGTIVPTLERADALWRPRSPDKQLALNFEQPASWMLLFALVCFDDDGSELARLDRWFTPACPPVLYAMVLKGFVPGHAYASAYDLKYTAMLHEEAIVSALLQPRDTWARTLGDFMKKWPKLMKRHGYRLEANDSKYPFNEFPLHLALAVCAYDIDDSAFEHLPFYPRDLVGYYRAHRRDTRDARRPADLDPAAGLPASARPQPKKTYALTKGEAYARWVELVCGEEADRIARARKALGARKTMPALDCVLEALATQGFAIRADIKDDATLQAQLLALCDTLRLPAPALPPQPPAGPARCGALLTALHAQAAAHGRTLIVADNEDDAWNAVLVDIRHDAEFALLCEQLGIARLAAGSWQ